MEVLNIERWLSQIEKKLFLFFITFSSTQIIFLESRFVFLIPLLCLSFVIGRLELGLSLMAIGIGALLLQDYTLLLFSVVLIVLLLLMVPLYSMKTRSIAFVSSFYYAFVNIVFLKHSVNVSLLGMVICFLGTYYLLAYTAVLIHKKEVLKPNEICFIGILCLIALLPIFQLSSVFLMVWIRFLLLGILYIAGFKTACELAVISSVLLVLLEKAMVEEVVMLLLPMSFLYLIKTPTKLALGTVYVLSHLLIPFFTEKAIVSYVYEVVFSAICFMMIPPHFQLLCERNTGGQSNNIQLASAKKTMTSQLENYSDLFYRIAHSFNDMQLDTNVIFYVGSIKQNLCEKCINHQDCFNKNKGDHRLIKLLKKGIIEGLNKEEQHYVECYCLHMAQYKKLMNEQHKFYQHQKEMNEEYQMLKHHLYDQLTLVGELLKNYANNIAWTNFQSEEHMKELLEGYHYKIWYIHKEELSLQTFSIEIGMTEITKKEVYDVVIPVLEKSLDTKLRVIKMENNASQLGYTHLILSNHHHFDLIYGFQQISKDKDHCGDSYLTFRHQSKTIFALSDGMGYGKRAHEESELTLDVFSRLLKSGIALNDCVQTVNALLRIKNRIEMFTTLDLFMFDTSIGEATFIKNGAMPTYIYRNQELIKIEPSALPIGIVYDVKTFQKTMPLHEGDVVIMYSDGFDEGLENIIEDVLNTISHQHPQTIADQVMKKMVNHHLVDDDATIIVLEVNKVMYQENLH